MSFLWLAAGMAALVPLLIIQQRRIVALRRSQRESTGGLGDVGVITEIAESKHLDRILLQSELRFRTLAENMPANAVRYDRQARVLFVSPALLADITPELLPKLGQSLTETFPGNDAAASHQRVIERVIATGTPAEFEFQIPNPRGEMRVHHIHYVAERDDDGEIVGAMAIGRDITEHKRAEGYEQFRSQTLELLSEGASLQGVLENIVLGVEQLNPEMICSILLLDKQGRRLGQSIAPSLPDFYNAAIEGLEIGVGVGCCGTAAATGERVIADNIKTHPYWAPYKELAARAGLGACWSEPIHSSSGQVLGTFAIYHRQAHSPAAFDIFLIEGSARLASIAIERKRAEESLRVSEQQFRTLAENMPDNIARYDRHGRWVYLNRQLEETLGVEARDILGKTLPETFLDKADAAYLACLATVLETGQPGEIDVVWPHAHNSPRYHNVRFVAECGREGEVVGALAMGRDFTEKHHAQRELEIRNIALNTSNDAVFLIDDTQRFVFVNETACRSLGYSREELLTMGTPDIDPDITLETAQAMTEAMLGRSDIPKFETRHRAKDGRIYPVEIGGAVFKYEGRTFGLSVVRDISERKRMEDALRFVARRGWRKDDKNFFEALVPYLCQTLGVDYAMVTKMGEAPGNAETVALFTLGAVVPNIRYDLAGTPCEHVMGRNYCCYPSGVQQLFPENRTLAEMRAESYAGIPLWDSCGQPLGLIAILDGKPLQNEAWVAQLLQIVAPRAAAELESARSDAQLRAREREFRSLAESSPDCIIRYDRAGRFVYLNSQVVGELGVASATDVIGRLPCEIWPDGRFAVIEQAIAQAMVTAADVTIETTVPQPSGEQNFSQIRVVPEWDDAGEVIGAIAFGRDITELKRYQQTLSAREREFRSLAENAPDSIARYDREGRILYVNPRLAETLGVAACDVVGKMAQIAYPGLDVTPIARVVATGEPVESEFTSPDFGWGLRHWHIRLVAERGPQGDIVGVLGIGRDITKRKRAERDLVVLGSAINNASEGIFLINDQLRFTYVNDQACRSLGYSRDQLLTMGPADIDADIPRHELERMHDSLLTHGPRLGRMETRHRAADGRVFPVEMSASLVEHENEKMALVVANDISERKRAERELRILTTAINSASDSIFLIDERLRFIYVNDRACRALGYSRDDLLTMGPADLHTDIAREDLARMRAHLLANGSQVRMEARVRAADGRPIVTELTASLVEHESERMALVVARDISERKRAERELRILTTAINSASDGILLINEQLQFTYVNDRACRSLGHSREELLTMGPADIETGLPYDDLARVRAHLLSQGPLVRLETRLRAADGRAIPIEITASLVEHENEKMALAVVRDISERKQAEAQHQAHLHFLESLDRIDRAIQGTNDLDTMMRNVLDTVLTVFDCDRAFLLYPCDPAAPAWRVPMERTRPEYPCALDPEREIANHDEVAATLRILMDAYGPEQFGPGTGHPLPAESAARFGFKSLLSMAVHPRMDKPWQFGIHQCTHVRAWNAEEEMLFHEIGRRLADGLTGLIAHRRLQESEAHLRTLVQTIPDLVWLKSPEGVFLHCNSRFERLFGTPMEEIVGKTDDDFVEPELAERFREHDRKTLASGKPSVNEEWLSFAADGYRGLFETVKTPLRDDAGKLIGVLGVARDITERKRLEEALRRREEEFRSLAEHLPDIVMRYDLECRHVYVNPAFVREMEIPEQEVLKAAPDVRHWRSSNLSLDEYTKRLRWVMTSEARAELMVDWSRSSDGAAAHYVMTIVAEHDADGHVIGALCVGRNVTRLMVSERRLEESRRQLRILAARREDAREEERRHIARELHDELGQQLSALRFNLALLAYEFGATQPQIKDVVDKLLGFVGNTIRTIREVSSALRPPVLDMGIVPALEWLVAEYAPHGGVCFELQGEPDGLRMNDACTVVVFRVVQESLTNAVRHSKADRIEVVLGREADAYVVEIRDNGIGFDPDGPRDRRSVGLLGIRERAFAVGGELVISSAPSWGTVLRVRIPAETDQKEES